VLERRTLPAGPTALVSTALEDAGFLAAFTERTGGSSEGPFRSLNLGLATEDSPERVFENRGRSLTRLPQDSAVPTSRDRGSFPLGGCPEELGVPAACRAPTMRPARRIDTTGSRQRLPPRTEVPSTRHGKGAPRTVPAGGRRSIRSSGRATAGQAVDVDATSRAVHSSRVERFVGAPHPRLRRAIRGHTA